jgi:parvulin-like peptidyl-prolyl isomerase
MAKKKHEELADELEDESLDDEESHEDDEELEDEDEDDEELEDEDEDDEELEDEDEDDEELEDADDEELEDEDDEELEDEDEDEEPALGHGEQDPYWWTPHLVLGLLLVVGLLGFFGAFNRWVGHWAPTPGEHTSNAPAVETPAAAAPVVPASAPARDPQRPPASQEIYGARHILVQYAGAQKAPPELKRTKDEAKKVAETAAAEAKKTKTAENRADAWKALAVKHDDPHAERTGGDLGRFRPGAYDESVVETVKKMAVGDISDPVESAFGYRVLWRTL